jgi:hypothetical protein
MNHFIVTQEMIQRERDFLNAIHYRNKDKEYDLILYLRRNVSTSPHYHKYYSKIYLIDAFKVSFRDYFHQFLAAASDYALKKVETEIQNKRLFDEKKKYELFINFFYYLEFALVEIDIAYYRIRRKHNATKEARKSIFESHFGGKLLKDNGYEINSEPYQKLNNKLNKYEKELINAESKFRTRSNRGNYKFFNNISAICHYRKHFIKDELHLNIDIEPQNIFVKLSFSDYMNEANDTLSKGCERKKNEWVLDKGQYQQIAIISEKESNHKHIVSYKRHYSI